MVYTADKRLYVNADRSKVVDEDSQDAAFLLVGEGGQLPDEEAQKYGLHPRDDEASKSTPESESKAVEKAPANKAHAKASDK